MKTIWVLLALVAVTLAARRCGERKEICVAPYRVDSAKQNYECKLDAGACGFQECCVRGKRYYIGQVNPADTERPLVDPPHPMVSYGAAGPYLGIAESEEGPFDLMAMVAITEGEVCEFKNTVDREVFFTENAGGTVGLENGISGGTHTAGGHVANRNDVLRVNTSALTATTFSYQEYAGADNAGFYVHVAPCVHVKPTAPILLKSFVQPNAVSIGEALKWSAADFGRRCSSWKDADFGPQYYVLIKKTSQDGELTSATAHFVGGKWSDFAQQIPIPAYQPLQLVLKQDFIELGTQYQWKVVAVFGDHSNWASSDVSTFTTVAATGASSKAAIQLDNAAVRQDRIFPTVPAGHNGVKYYSFNVENGHGTLYVGAMSSALDVADAPAAGSVKVEVVGPRNTTFPRCTPTKTSCEVRITNAPAGMYQFKVESNPAAATFALAVNYMCDEYSFLTDRASTRCSACPVHSSAAHPGAASVAECKCNRGFFGPAGGPCEPCPTGGICDGSPKPAARLGYYSSISDAGQYFFKCPLESACLGGPESTCNVGYNGTLCANCDENYYKLGGQCYECPDSPEANFAFGVILLLLFLLASFELARFYRKISSVTVVINFLQTTALFTYYQLNWPQYLQKAFNDCSGFNLNTELTAPECLEDDGMKWTTKWGFTLLFPLLVFGIMAIAYLFGWAAHVVLHHSKPSERELFSKHAFFDMLAPSFVTFLLFVYASLTRASLSFFDCTEQPDGSYTLDESADILCYSSEWNTYLPAAIVSTFVYAVLIPLGFAILLALRSSQLYALSAEGDDMYNWLGPVYIRYKAELFWWELLNFLRKALLLIVGAFFTTFPLFQAVLAIAILTTALMLQVTFDPYEFKETNFLETLLLFVQIMLFLAGLVFRSDEIDADGLPQFIFVFILVAFAICFAASMVVIFWELSARYKAVPREYYDRIIQQLHEIQREELELRPAHHHFAFAPRMPFGKHSDDHSG